MAMYSSLVSQLKGSWATGMHSHCMFLFVHAAFFNSILCREVLMKTKNKRCYCFLKDCTGNMFSTNSKTCCWLFVDFVSFKPNVQHWQREICPLLELQQHGTDWSDITKFFHAAGNQATFANRATMKIQFTSAYF